MGNRIDIVFHHAHRPASRANALNTQELMARKKSLRKKKKVALKLTIDERKLILGDPIEIPKELAEPIQATATGAPVMLTLDDLKDLGGFIAAGANQTKGKKIRKKLDAVFSKIQDLLVTHSDEGSTKTLKIKDAERQKLVADEDVELPEWAARMLLGAEQLGIKDKPVKQFQLPWAERGVLLLFTSADKTILNKLEAEKPSVTIGEVIGLLMKVAEALLDAPQLHRQALLSTANSLMYCLEAEVTGARKT
jgi:hypothetical protein